MQVSIMLTLEFETSLVNISLAKSTDIHVLHIVIASLIVLSER